MKQKYKTNFGIKQNKFIYCKEKKEKQKKYKKVFQTFKINSIFYLAHKFWNAPYPPKALHL